MRTFLETYNVSKLTQGEIEISTDKTSKKIELVIKNLSTKKSSGPNGFTDEFYQTFKEELTPILLKLFPKTEKEGTLPISFCEASVTLI